ncbi:hypothetical protein O181_094425 [Austropuccinia psidii MF-1]|uniref:Uncharacterized protein n=1 Tax=Austropuccinia psidii MF-1 TaxID=1389203 RepID=A0A9Q3J3N5_9BASI|nr:hypothetical protein [Austropuccinia psidii MF-1]
MHSNDEGNGICEGLNVPQLFVEDVHKLLVDEKIQVSKQKNKQNQVDLSGPIDEIPTMSKKKKKNSVSVEISNSINSQDAFLLKHLDYQKQRDGYNSNLEEKLFLMELEQRHNELQFIINSYLQSDWLAKENLLFQQKSVIPSEKITAVKEWVQRGKSPEEINELLKITFG